ncbi:jg23202 [Pararge aegeria aegeria]|uniref:Jg23202 protein n=1 Tax=Pararge aegeria aegeria TaxID=348720 RepID=A0A8S4QM27_9NEOP|nr:jg23202 [Pararge aegeria aegeria]
MGLIRRLRVTQPAMERAMLGVSLRDQIRNEEDPNGDPAQVSSPEQAAQGRGFWNSLQKTYVQQWTSIG